MNYTNGHESVNLYSNESNAFWLKDSPNVLHFQNDKLELVFVY